MADNKINQYAAFISSQIEKEEVESVNESHPAVDEPEYHSDKVDEITKKIEKINRSGGRVGPNHPLSQKLSHHMGELKRTRALKRREMDEEVEQVDEMGKKGTFRPVSPGVQNARTAQAATQGDKALDKEYHYGTTKGGVSPIAGKRKEQGFGSVANFNSAHAALTSKGMGGNSKAQDSAVHQGWGKTVDQMPAPNPEKQAARKKLQQTPFSALSKGEQEKDTVLRKGITETIDEVFKLGSRVRIHIPGKRHHGEEGTVSEIRRGLPGVRPKYYTVDHGGTSSQLPKENLRIVKEEVKFSDEELEAINDIINEAEDNNSADFHKASFEYHAKKFLGHNAAMNSSRADDDLAYFDKHDAEESKHGAAAVHHAAAYHKITGKRIEMVPRAETRDPMMLPSKHIKDVKADYPHDDNISYLNLKKPKSLGKTYYDELK